MSVIFPKEPAKVTIQLLPKNVEMVSYKIEDALTISAWMPEKFIQIKQKNIQEDDDFYQSNCSGCERNCSSFLEAYEDEDGYVDWDNEDLIGHCSVYEAGYCGQSCPLGYEIDEKEKIFDVNNMVFSIKLTHIGENPRFKLVGDSAWIQKFKLTEETPISKKFKATYRYMASNVYGDSSEPSSICWGFNDKPKNIREIVSQYFTTPFNNDLLSIKNFEYNCEDILNLEDYSYNRAKSENYFSDNIDGIMLLDAEDNIQGFFTMLMAGFKPLDEAMHIMMIPLKEAEITRGDSVYKGLITPPDSVGKSWFVSQTSDEAGLLVGQL